MDLKTLQDSAAKLLSRRESELVPRNNSTDETVNNAIVKTQLINLPSTAKLKEQKHVKFSKPPIFEPLDEDGERYLQEVFGLPPIDLTSTPTRYYINPHPTESLLSSSSEEEDGWRMDGSFSEEQIVEVERPRCRRRVERTKEVVHLLEQPAEKTFPKTLEMRRERRLKELREEEQSRAEIICKLEKQMVSLYNLKRQYKRTLAGKGCPGTRAPPLPPLRVLGPAGDKLELQRNSLLSRIKRKKFEDELKRKKQIERKINIVRTILNEQKQTEKELQNKIKKVTQSSYSKQKKPKEELSKTVLNEFEETSNDLEKAEVTEDVTPTEETSAEKVDVKEDEILTEEPTADLAQSTIDTQKPADDAAPSPDHLPSPELSPRKSSKGKGEKSRKKKSAELTNKQDVKKKKGKKKDTVEVEETPAICELAPELPASQLTELSLWLQNWRENISEQLSEGNEWQQLPEEADVTLTPCSVVFKNVLAGVSTQQAVMVTNRGQTPLQCRVQRVQQPANAYIQAILSGPSKARMGHSWSLTITLDTMDDIEDSSVEVVMVCCRGTLRSRVCVVVQVLAARPEPTLSTSTMRFRPQMFWNSVPVTKHLHISNPGGLGCVVHWTEVVDRVSPLAATDIDSPSPDDSDASDGPVDAVISTHSQLGDENMSREVAKDILKTVVANVFSTFRIDHRQPLVLPPQSRVSLPVRFTPSMSPDRGEVFAKYRFWFEGENVDNEYLDLVICGKIERSPFRLEYEVVNMKLCYTGGLVQQARLVVLSSARHSCHVTVRIPRTMAGVVSVVPRSTVVAANSYVKLVVRLMLGADFLERPCRYLDAANGLLMFPVAVCVTDAGAPAPPLDATVIASVAPACPLTLAPSMMDLGHVTTMETVEADLLLSNHHRRPYNYAFVNLPQSIMIEPGGGCGCILPLETVKLKLLLSPRAQDVGVDCGRPGGEGEVNFTLRCFTTVSMASPIRNQHSQKEHVPQKTMMVNKSESSFSNTVRLHTIDSQIKKISGSDGFQSSSEDERHHSGRKVTFKGGSTKTSDESLAHSSDHDGKYKEDMDGDEPEGNKEPDEDQMVISEITDEVQEPATDELWKLYSNFQLDKCPEENRGGRRMKEETNKTNEEDEFGDNAMTSSVEIRDSAEETKTDSDRSTQIGIEGETKVHSKDGDFKMKENVGIISDPDSFGMIENVQDHWKEEGRELLSKSDSNNSESSGEGKLENAKMSDMCLLPETSQRFASFSVKAYVTDPLVELSSQLVVLPPTACCSYNIAHVYLRSRHQKPCSVHDKITKFKTQFEFRSPRNDLIVEPRSGYISYNKSQKISIIFRPNLSDKDISDKALEMKVENMKWQKIQDMMNDYNKSKEIKQTKVKFDEKKPEKQANDEGGTSDEKPQEDTSENPKGKGKKSKANVDIKQAKIGKKKPERQSNDEGMDSKKPQAEKSKNQKDKGKKSKESVVSFKTKKTKGSLKSSKLRKKSSGPLPDVVIDPSEVKLTEEDLKYTEMSMLKYLEPYKETLTILCLLETEMEDGSRRHETLSCDVLCSIVAPTIYLSTPACVDFGPVAVGTTSRLAAIVTNISFFDAPVRLSTLSPVGPFKCAAHLECPYWKNGELELPPEHILAVPLYFHPTESSEAVEQFEVISGSTVLQLQARGRGVSPSFTFQPEREVFMVMSAPGKKTDISVAISNTCEAPLKFRINLEFLKEGQSLPTPIEDQSQAADTGAKKKDIKKEKKGKGLPEFTVLNEELEKCLENEFAVVENDENAEPVIKALNCEDSIVVESGETKQVVLRFTPPGTKREVITAEIPQLEKGSRKSSPENSNRIKSKRIEINDTPTNKTKLSKSDKKKTRSSAGKEEKKKDSFSVKSEKKVDVKLKQIYAARFSVVLADTLKVKDWIVLGTKK